MSLDELVALSLRTLRRAPTGLAALLSATSEALGARLVATCLTTGSEPPETLGVGGPDRPRLSQRTGEDHDMLRGLSRHLEPYVVPAGERAGVWTEYAHVCAISSRIDDQTNCVVVAAGDSQLDPSDLTRASAPLTVLAFVIAQDRISKDLRHQAVETDQQLSLLLASLHHDLRTPLTGILGSARTLIQRDSQIGPDVRAELLESIVRQADRLTRMVGATLDRTRERDRPVRRAMANLRDLTEHSVAAAMMSRKGSIIIEAPDLDICTDPDRLERVLLNLLDNALKYSPPDSPVYLIADPHDGWARITVADRGPGVSHDVLPQLFAPYVSDPLRGDGTGLGLTSAKHIIEEDLKGRISYSRHEGWTRFVIDVPIDGRDA